MSSEKYINASKNLMNEKQRKIMANLYMKGDNHDGHSWNTFSDIEDAVAEILEAGQYIGMLTKEESADATILNIQGWDYEVNGKYPIDEQNGRALFEEYVRLKTENEDLKKRIAVNKFLGSL